MDNNRIYLFDTTLRDGEQAPGLNLNKAEKLEIARLLESLGVDIIEAGFAASSPGDFEAVELISKSLKDVSVATLCRSVPGDIEKGAAALKHAVSPLIHVFIATSPIHMEYKLRMTPDQVLERAVASVKLARNYTDQVEFSCEDGSRSEPEFLYKILTQVIDAGATILNIPDTVGYALPDEFAALIRGVHEHVPNIHKARISVHCHDDLGMAVSNSLAALGAGARQIEGTINGLGERAGNAALEEVIMALNTRSAHFGYTCNAKTTNIYRTAATVAHITGQDIPPSKAIVGKNAFRHESGIHQHGVMANPLTYEIMTPASVGIVVNPMVLGKHSGRHAFVEKLKEMGYVDFTDEQVDKAFAKFKQLADAKKDVSDRDIEALMSQKLMATPETYVLDSFMVQSSNKILSTASVLIKNGDDEKNSAGSGNGPVDALFGAIAKACSRKVTLESYAIKAVTEGADALGEVTVRVTIDGVSALGRGLSMDIIEASARAYVAAINRAVFDLGTRTEEQLETDPV